jgi:sarcosine oxidase gamma subunit
MSRQTAQKPFSIRMSEQTLARLDLGAQRRGEAKSRTAERLIDEGLRMADHPGIVFRDGPAGRRAALAVGPDVWEVVQTLKETGLAGEHAIAAAAEWGNLSHAQVNAALRYYVDFPEEVDEKIAHNRNESERQHAAWLRTREALA